MESVPPLPQGSPQPRSYQKEKIVFFALKIVVRWELFIDKGG
jgi:hypothetical protein